jgi:hypothetical protein
LVSSTHLGLTTTFLLLSDIYGFVDVGRCLTRGRVCHLQLLLVFASSVILGSECRGTRDHILLSRNRDSLGGPVLRIYIPHKQGGPVIPPGTGFPLRRLLRLAGRSTIPVIYRRDGPTENTFHFVSKKRSVCQTYPVSMEMCSVMSWFPRIHLHGNVFVNSFPSIASACHNIFACVYSVFVQPCRVGVEYLHRSPASRRVPLAGSVKTRWKREKFPPSREWNHSFTVKRILLCFLTIKYYPYKLFLKVIYMVITNRYTREIFYYFTIKESASSDQIS